MRIRAQATYENLADGLVIPSDRPDIPRRDSLPPRIQRLAVAAELHAHAAGEPDPVGEAIARHGDDHGDVRAQCAPDQK